MIPKFEICNRPDGTWFIHFVGGNDFQYTHITNVIEYLNEFSKFLDDKLNLGMDGCYSRGMNWQEAAEHVCKNLEDDCARQVFEKFVMGQRVIDSYINTATGATQHMYEACNRKTYGYRSTMSTDEKVEQMCLNKFALDILTFKKL